MKDEYKVIILSLLIGISLWVADSLIDSYLFFEKSFLDSLIFHVTGHELYFRVILFAGFIVFGLVISVFIKKHRKIEKKLKDAVSVANEEKSKSEGIIATMSDGVSVIDTGFRITYQNRVHREIIGDHQGEYCYHAYESRNSVCPDCPVAQSFRDGKVHSMEKQLKSDNAEGHTHIEITASPLRNSDGKITGAIQVIRDITERKWAEEFIKISKKDWEDTFDTIDDIITIHDNSFNVIRTNRAAENVFGITVQEIIRSKCFKLFHGKDTPPTNCPSCKCLETGEPVTTEYFEPNLNKYLEIKAIPRVDPENQPLGIIHIVRDITERKKIENELARHRDHLSDLVKEKTADLTSAINLLNDEITSRKHAEEALRISEKKYRDLYNNAPDMYHTLDTDKIIIDCNNTEATMLGYKKEEIIGRPLSDFFDEESKKLLEKDFPEIKKKKVLRNLKRTFVRKDGTTFPAILNVYADFDKDGQLICTRAIARDISELERAEEEAMRASHLASLGELAAGVAHEINNPINGIINYAELILRKSLPDSTEREISGRIIKEGDRIANIVRSLLSFARDSREEKKPVTVNEIMADTLTLTETQLRKDGIRLEVTIPENLPLIFAQPQQIEQVFLNIISNARYALNVKYPGTHDEKLMKIEGEISSTGNGNAVVLTFYDQGCGIRKEHMDKIMNPFFSTKPGNIGTGLGLSISHGIIADHNGKLLVESKQDIFTRVTVELQAYAPEEN